MDYVAMSGGIDSTARALLMPDAELVFTDTGDATMNGTQNRLIVFQNIISSYSRDYTK